MKLVTSKTEATNDTQLFLDSAEQGDVFLMQDSDGEQWAIMYLDNGAFVTIADDDRTNYPCGNVWDNVGALKEDLKEYNTKVTFLEDAELRTNV